jgi:hypothetical protein
LDHVESNHLTVIRFEVDPNPVVAALQYDEVSGLAHG